ncbi:hypothetical protein NQ315_013758, partial [Exocentrus adspersus]
YGRRQSHVLRERERERDNQFSSNEKSTATSEPIYCTVKDDISKSVTPTPSTPTPTGVSNEVAYYLARRGAASELIGTEPVLGRTLSFEGIDAITLKARSKTLLELSRINLQALVELYTRHCCHLRHDMHRIGLAEDAECQLCMEDDEMA